jgi:periplasmic divalent cation tolerance protein
MTAEYDLCEIVITAPNAEWLAALCRQLVEKRLASSANVMREVLSVYRWQGRIHETKEARAFLRSRMALVDEIVAYVVERHPYDVPNVTAIPLIGGNPRYLEWIRAETSAPR